MKCSLKKNVLVSVSVVVNVALLSFFAWGVLKNVVAINAYEKARQDTIVQVIQTAQKCEPFSLFAGEVSVELQMNGCSAQAEVLSPDMIEAQ